MIIRNCLKQIETELTNWFETIQFVKFKDTSNLYSKETEKYNDFISLHYEITGKVLIVQLQSFAREIKFIENFWTEYINNPLVLHLFINPTLRGGGDKRTNHKVNLIDVKPDIVEVMCPKIKSDYYEIVAPLLDEYSNIHKLDAVANGDDKTFSIGNERDFRKLIIAKLAGNMNYESIYDEIYLRVSNGIKQYPNETHYQEYLWVIEQIYKKLKNVYPLENPNLI